LKSKRRHSLDTADYSTFETVCQELFSWPENFVLSGRSSLLHRAAMPCPYWFRLCAPLTDVSVRPVSQSVTNSILTASRPCYAVSGVPSSQCRSGVPAVVSSTVCMIPYAAQFVNQYFSLFLASFDFRIHSALFSELFGVVFSALFQISALFPHYNYFSVSGKEKGSLSFFDMLLNF
jgi:hypothetical protein